MIVKQIISGFLLLALIALFGACSAREGELTLTVFVNAFSIAPDNEAHTFAMFPSTTNIAPRNMYYQEAWDLTKRYMMDQNYTPATLVDDDPDCGGKLFYMNDRLLSISDKDAFLEWAHEQGAVARKAYVFRSDLIIYWSYHIIDLHSHSPEQVLEDIRKHDMQGMHPEEYIWILDVLRNVKPESTHYAYIVQISADDGSGGMMTEDGAWYSFSPELNKDTDRSDATRALIWRTVAVTTSTSPDFRKVYPIILASMSDYIAKDTRHVQSISIKETDSAVRHLRALYF